MLAELLSLWAGLAILFRKRSHHRRLTLTFAASALVVDGFALWLCFLYAPARFDTNLVVIIRQFPDVGVFLVPVLALALIWPVPRTAWLFRKARKAAPEPVVSPPQ